MATLRIKKVDTQLPPMNHAELEERLKKMIDSKGRDKGRQNFNLLGSDQMRSLKYKKKVQYTYNNPFKSTKDDKAPEKDD